VIGVEDVSSFSSRTPSVVPLALAISSAFNLLCDGRCPGALVDREKDCADAEESSEGVCVMSVGQ
jgi:hypothetical protein